MPKYINIQIPYSCILDSSVMLPKESDDFNDLIVQSIRKTTV